MIVGSHIRLDIPVAFCIFTLQFMTENERSRRSKSIKHSIKSSRMVFLESSMMMHRWFRTGNFKKDLINFKKTKAATLSNNKMDSALRKRDFLVVLPCKTT